ncbi:hypothetical protein SEVIR_1G214800v4 [Setaria viridis]|uniref:Uncharacterized protein n=1 Tax=Setaria viridis TaxID=4556 RepID=A0A4U6WMZ9_SETVI|nr:uncharacterized protein LOC117844814 [Setaria viridis]TKW39967.1 hypothetical protein SEVIR_1G214800v2 [Setaria viridis]
MGCRRASSTTLLIVILAVVFLLTLDRPVAHARHLRSPSTSTAEHSSREKGSQRTRSHGVEHTKNAETVRLEKGSTGEGAAGASVVGRGGNSPAASAEKVVVARYGPRPHPKKHN